MTRKSLIYEAEVEGIGQMLFHFTATHVNGEAPSHPDGPQKTIDLFEVESIDRIFLRVGRVDSVLPPLNRDLGMALIGEIEHLLVENPDLFWNDEILAEEKETTPNEFGVDFPFYCASPSSHLKYKVLDKDNAIEIGTDHISWVAAKRAFHGGYVPVLQKEVNEAFKNAQKKLLKLHSKI